MLEELPPELPDEPPELPEEPPEEEEGELGEGMLLGELEDCCSTHPPTSNALTLPTAVTRPKADSSRLRE